MIYQVTNVGNAPNLPPGNIFDLNVTLMKGHVSGYLLTFTAPGEDGFHGRG